MTVMLDVPSGLRPAKSLAPRQPHFSGPPCSRQATQRLWEMMQMLQMYDVACAWMLACRALLFGNCC